MKLNSHFQQIAHFFFRPMNNELIDAAEGKDSIRWPHRNVSRVDRLWQGDVRPPVPHQRPSRLRYGTLDLNLNLIRFHSNF